MSGRIPQQFIDDLLERVDIVDVIDARVSLKKTGKNYTALCPFHKEKSPSFSVNPDKQFYYCFGCGAGGNAIGFLMEFERLEFLAAVEMLAGVAGMELPKEAEGTRTSPRQTELAARVDAAAQWFRQQLAEHAQATEARAYLQKRGLSPETGQRFGIGYAPPGWDGLLRALGKTEADTKLLFDTGLLIRRDDGGFYDRFRDRIMFPIRDNRGRTVAFGGRVLSDEKPKYLNSPETPLFHKGQELYGLHEARQSKDLDKILVVEGYMDVVMLAQFGINNAVGTLGTALSSQHVQRLFRYTSSIVFCFDGDDAGRRAAARALDLVLPAMLDGRQAAFMFLPEGQDPDSMVQAIGTAAFRERVDAAMPLAEFLFEHFGQGIDTDALDGRARLGKIVLPAIERVPGGIFKQLLRQSLAQRIGISVDGLATKPEPRVEPEPPVPPQDLRSVPGRPVMGAHRQSFQPKAPSTVRSAIRMVLHSLPLALSVTEIDRLKGLDDPHAPLFAQLLVYIQANPGTSLGALLGYWHGTTEGEFLARLAAEEPLTGVDMERDFLEILEHLDQKAVARDAETLRREIESIPWGELSPEQKQTYLQIIAGKTPG